MAATQDRPTRVTVAVFQLLPDALEADVLVGNGAVRVGRVGCSHKFRYRRFDRLLLNASIAGVAA